MITDALIFRESGQYDKEMVHRLHLSNQGISRITSLEPCVSLVELVLSYNEIGFIAGLDSLVALRVLDLSFNRIRRLENLKRLSSLESLDLRGNQIATLDDITEVKDTPSLQSLALKGVDGEDSNPVCAATNYSGFVLAALPNLLVLDGGHTRIRDAFGTIEDDLEKLRPDPAVCSAESGRPSKAQAALEDTQRKLADMLAEDCSHLLRKAQQALSKASKP